MLPAIKVGADIKQMKLEWVTFVKWEIDAQFFCLFMLFSRFGGNESHWCALSREGVVVKIWTLWDGVMPILLNKNAVLGRGYLGKKRAPSPPTSASLWLSWYYLNMWGDEGNSFYAIQYLHLVLHSNCVNRHSLEQNLHSFCFTHFWNIRDSKFFQLRKSASPRALNLHYSVVAINIIGLQQQVSITDSRIN